MARQAGGCEIMHVLISSRFGSNVGRRAGSSLSLRKGKSFAEEFHHVVLESIGYVAGVGSRIDFE